MNRPVIGIPADRRMIGPHPFHAVGEKYIAAIAQAADCLPLLIPVLETPLDVAEILSIVDGIFFTGSPSNVEPHRYKGASSLAGTLHDPHRDATTLSLIPRAVSGGVPVFGVCRGFQEMNVAMGGTLHQRVHEVAGLADHREDKEEPLDVQYAPAHDVTLERGGLLAQLAGAERITVNSLHGQGVDRLGPDLAVEARAPDGLIEAFSVKSAPTFALAVQWHPEWKVMTNEFSKALFAEFGRAARRKTKR
ncbi:MAG TPA: gamma-glutamyl-gamma-aminobutyrate hydrolase family protein [Steroidobacteraceae bacterium]|nr:gamma-glutamyl-gamma-aminobutyrate hydrolase family protein [Steroidobacteraceae bacterium]